MRVVWTAAAPPASLNAQALLESKAPSGKTLAFPETESVSNTVRFVPAGRAPSDQLTMRPAAQPG